MYIYIYLYIYLCIHICICIYITYTNAYIYITVSLNTCKIRPENMSSDVDVGQRCVRVWDDFNSPRKVWHFEKRRQMSPPA